MQVSQPMLQLLLYKKAQNEQAKQEEVSAETTNQPAVTNNAVNATNTTPTSEDYKIADSFAIQNINESAKKTINLTNKSTTLQAKTISSFSAAEITKIKQTIYDLHHKTTNPGTDGPGGTGSTTPDTPTPHPTSASKISFIDDFSDTDEMFNYINSINSSITKDSGITSHQLWELTQRDDWEENNSEFFGKLNLAFNEIDQDFNDILSNEEICAFLGAEINQTTYNLKVAQYSQELQTRFNSITNTQEKLNFAIEIAIEYLTAAGLTEQLSALERLQNENKIQIADLSEYGALGVYISWQRNDGTWISDDSDYDKDGNWQECGLFIDTHLATDNTTKWYELVDVLVHELTHATAYLHPNTPAAWGEYVAYQVDEDYKDSIAEGYWSGTAEGTRITEHINDNYKNEKVPTFDWTTYGTYA